MDEGTLHIRQPGPMEFVEVMLGLLTQHGIASAADAGWGENYNREDFLNTVASYLKGLAKRQSVTKRFLHWVENTKDPAFKGAELNYTSYGIALTVKLSRVVLEFKLTGPAKPAGQGWGNPRYMIGCKTHYHCLACHEIKFSGNYCITHFFEKLAKGGLV